MEKRDTYHEMGLRALKRAAEKVAEDARKNNYKFPIWRNGRIEFEIPQLNKDQNRSNERAFTTDE